MWLQSIYAAALLGCSVVTASDCNVGGLDFSFIGNIDAVMTLNEPQYSYTFRICSALQDKCAGNMGCQYDTTTKTAYPISIMQGTKAVKTGTGYVITYGGHVDNGGLVPITRQSILQLDCLTSNAPKAPSLASVVERQEPNSLVTFTFQVMLNCQSKKSKKSKLSFGDVMCIIIPLGFFFYFLGGFLFLKFAREKEGKEMIPNYGFWSAIPGLTLDGCRFIRSKTCGGGDSSSGGGDYDRL